MVHRTCGQVGTYVDNYKRHGNWDATPPRYAENERAGGVSSTVLDHAPLVPLSKRRTSVLKMVLAATRARKAGDGKTSSTSERPTKVGKR
jgi:hypothetical protein